MAEFVRALCSVKRPNLNRKFPLADMPHRPFPDGAVELVYTRADSAHSQ